MREIARNIARERMKKQGIQHMNKKKPITNKSFFADNWRNYVRYEPHTIVAHNKKRVKGHRRAIRQTFLRLNGGVAQ